MVIRVFEVVFVSKNSKNLNWLGMCGVIVMRFLSECVGQTIFGAKRLSKAMNHSEMLMQALSTHQEYGQPPSDCQGGAGSQILGSPVVLFQIAGNRRRHVNKLFFSSKVIFSKNVH